MLTTAVTSDTSASRRMILLFALLSGVGAFATWDGWRDLVETAARHHDSDASILAPPVAAWLFWQRRSTLRQAPTLRLLAVPLALASVALVGHAIEADVHVAGHFGALLSFFAAFVAVFGARAARGTLAAWGALLFLIPLPGLVRIRIGQPLQEYGAQLSERALAPLGFQVERLGASLVIDGVPVAVSEACDGMRMVSALMLVVFAVAFGRESRAWIRIAMLLSAPLLAIACNAIRLVPTVLGYAMLDLDVADALHDALGWVTLPLCLVLVELLRLALSALSRAAPPPATELRAAPPVRPGSRLRPAAPLLAALAFVGGWTQLPSRIADPAIETRYAAVRDAVDALPDRLGPWRTSPIPIPLAEQAILKPNAMVSRRLSLLGSPFEAQLLLIHCRDVRDMLGHWPASCYVSAGWSPDRGAARVISVERGSLQLKALRHRFSRVRGGSDQEKTEVWSAFLAPGAPPTGSIDDLSGRAGALLRSQQGIAQIQVCMSGWVDDVVAEEQVTSVLRAIPEELLELLKGDVGTPPVPDSPSGDGLR